eukprot:5591911-Amphidinium_carterae.3
MQDQLPGRQRSYNSSVQIREQPNNAVSRKDTQSINCLASRSIQRRSYASSQMRCNSTSCGHFHKIIHRRNGDVVKWKHALSLIHFGTTVTDKPAFVSNPPPLLPKKQGGEPVAFGSACRGRDWRRTSTTSSCELLRNCRKAWTTNFAVERPEKRKKKDYSPELVVERLESLDASFDAFAPFGAYQHREMNAPSTNVPFWYQHAHDYYNQSPPPEHEPNVNYGGAWRAIIRSDNCMLGAEGQSTSGWSGSHAGELFVPTKEEWKMIERVFEEGTQITTEMFAEISQE